jgi:hypothetical protein
MSPYLGILLYSSIAAQTPVTVSLNEQEVNFPNGQPIQVNGRVLVPLRSVFQETGASVKWVAETRTVEAVFDDIDVELQIGSQTAYINKKEVTLDVAPQIVNGSTMIPLRFVGEALGIFVDWQAAEHRVSMVSVNVPHEHPWRKLGAR